MRKKYKADGKYLKEEKLRPKIKLKTKAKSKTKTKTNKTKQNKPNKFLIPKILIMIDKQK